jgi:cell division protein FtsI (penicillin-binding protein 3)
MSYGYGISVSLFQMARAYTILANDGQLLPVTIFKHDPKAESIVGPQIISTRTAKHLRTMLESVVFPGGSALSAQIPGYRVGGKTGTAYKHVSSGYDKSKYRASIVGIAPLSAPRIIVAISIDEPTADQHFGGQVCAPVFAQIASDTLRILNTSPDKPMPPLMLAAPKRQPETVSFADRRMR